MGFFGIVTSFLVLVFGILVPARRTYHALGNENLIDWAKYWIVYAWFLCLELVGDTFLNWMPLYVELKLLFVLWMVMFVPQASVWIFEAILDPLMWRYLPQIDDMLQYDKRHMLRNALSFTSQICTRSMGSVVPMVSQIWRKSETQAAQVVDTIVYTAPEVSTPQFQDVEPPNVEDEASAQAMPKSFSNTPLLSIQKAPSKISVPELASKVPPRNLLKRGQLAHDLAIDSASNDDILFGMEDLLKNERLAHEMRNRSVLVRKDARRYH